MTKAKDRASPAARAHDSTPSVDNAPLNVLKTVADSAKRDVVAALDEKIGCDACGLG
jgi:hypothetical protein